MQIEITFVCRQCGNPNTLQTHTSDFGIASLPYHKLPNVQQALFLELRCIHEDQDTNDPCNHVSGIIALGYKSAT